MNIFQIGETSMLYVVLAISPEYAVAEIEVSQQFVCANDLTMRSLNLESKLPIFCTNLSFTSETSIFSLTQADIVTDPSVPNSQYSDPSKTKWSNNPALDPCKLNPNVPGCSPQKD